MNSIKLNFNTFASSLSLRLLSFLLITIVGTTAHAQTFNISAADSAYTAQEPIEAKQPSFKPDLPPIAVGTALVALGSTGIGKGSKSYKEHSTTLDNFLRFAPLAGYTGLCLFSQGHDRLETLAVGATAVLISTVITGGIKHVVKERRPDYSDSHSFPSGHTAIAFTGAELIRAEFGWKWGLAAYTTATCVGVLRLHHRKHWLNDVMAGAGIGILSAQAARLLLPVERKVFGWNKKQNTAVALPYFNPQNKECALTVALTL